MAAAGEAVGVVRLDASALRSPSYTPDGFLDVWATAATTGTLRYAHGDEEVTVDALDGDSAASLKDAPVIEEHVPDAPLVTPETLRDRQVGHVAEVRVDAEGQHVRLRITDADAIRRIMVEKKYPGVSPGYVATVDGKGRQVRRRNNHLALTKNPRGDKAVLRLDSEDSMEDEEKGPRSDAEKTKERMDAMEAKIDAMMKQVQDMCDKRNDEASEEEEEEDEERNDSFADLFAAHRRALDTAKALGIEVDAAKPTHDIRLACVKAKVGEVRNDSADYIAGVFDAIAASAKDRPTSAPAEAAPFDAFGRGQRPTPQTRNDSEDDLFADPRHIVRNAR